MVAIKSPILPTLFFIQGIQSYCITNKLRDGTLLKVSQNSVGKPFEIEVEQDFRECCPLGDIDCSNEYKAYEDVKFTIEMHYPGIKPYKTYAMCTTGGELLIHGSEINHYAECIYENGFSETFSLSTRPL